MTVALPEAQAVEAVAVMVVVAAAAEMVVAADVVVAVEEIDANFLITNPTFDETMESHLNYDAFLFQLL